MIDDPEKSPYLKAPKFFSGGGGLVSTARDYARFCQMMLNGGELDGTRLLKAETVAAMTRNQLPPEALPIVMPTRPGEDKSLGFGLGFGVRMTASMSDPSVVPGEYYWGGAASTGFVICPKNQTVMIALAQLMPMTTKLTDTFKRGVNEAIEERQAKRLKRDREVPRGAFETRADADEPNAIRSQLTGRSRQSRCDLLRLAAPKRDISDQSIPAPKLSYSSRLVAFRAGSSLGARRAHYCRAAAGMFWCGGPGCDAAGSMRCELSGVRTRRGVSNSTSSNGSRSVAK